MDVSPVQTQAAQLRTGHLDNPHLPLQQELNQFPKGGRVHCGAVGDRVLI